MAEKIKPAGTELFEQALKNYDQAFQAGLTAQEEVFKGILNCAGKMQAPEDWQKRWSAMVAESLPQAQKRIEESLKMVEQCSSKSMELLQQAFDAGKIDANSGAQAKIQELWEASLTTLRTNAQAYTQLNAKAVESWVQYFQRFIETSAAAVPKVKAA